MRTVFKVLLVLGVIAVGTIALLSFAGIYIAKNIRVEEHGTADKKNVNIDTPFGQMNIHAKGRLNPESVGIPIYPGATPSDKAGGADFQIDTGDLHKDVSVAGAVFYTNDSEDQVRAFYEKKFPDWSKKWENGEFRIEDKEDGRFRTVSIKREGGRTRVGVASVGSPASN